jgi:long-chain acyl-CoA synthetase
MAEDTLPKQLLVNARTLGKRDAMREKQYGIWQTYNWEDYAGEVKRFALGLAALGFQRGVTVLYTHDADFRRYRDLRVRDPLV